MQQRACLALITEMLGIRLSCPAPREAPSGHLPSPLVSAAPRAPSGHLPSTGAIDRYLVHIHVSTSPASFGPFLGLIYGDRSVGCGYGSRAG